jgi:protoporphyrinogen oxidase
LAAAWDIAGAGIGEVTVLERGSAVGGLAGSFEHDGRNYPLGYHHILPTDGTLLRFLELIGVRDDVEWRHVPLLFRIGSELYDLSRPADFLRLPIPLRQKLRFVALMLRAYRKDEWSDWEGRSAFDLLDNWGGPSVRETIFEPLCRLKFELRSDQVSAAWMGARLHAREGSGKLGYLPGTNWTKTLCDGVAQLALGRGVELRTGVSVNRLHTLRGKVYEVELEDGERIHGDMFISALPTEVLGRLLPDEPSVRGIRYSALLSMICGTRQDIRDDFYWLSLLSPPVTSSGIFLLSTLNPTIAQPGERCINFVTHLLGPDRPLFRRPEEELLDLYLNDYRAIFDVDLAIEWAHLSRVPAYSPVFTANYRNPDIRSSVWANLYLTGNYRSYPSVASTGTALRAGLETGGAVIENSRTEQSRTVVPFRRKATSPARPPTAKAR